MKVTTYVIMLSILIPASSTSLAQPSKNNGEACTSSSDCLSGGCWPGPGDGASHFCIALSRNCAWPGKDGFMYGAGNVWQGDTVTCKNPGDGTPGRFMYDKTY